MHPAIFLDRDGVLIENRADYVREWSQIAVFQKALKALSNSMIKSYKVVIVTNQSGVGRNLISLETAREINNHLVERIRENGGKVDGVYMCPHKPEDQCDCRKPQPGLLLQAARELSLDLRRSWMIGDAWSDVMAGKAAGVRGTIMVKTGRGAEQLLQLHPKGLESHFVFDDLSEALEAIYRIDKDSQS